MLSGAECIPSSSMSSSYTRSSAMDPSHAQSINDPNHVVDNMHCYSRPDDVYTFDDDNLEKGASSASTVGVAGSEEERREEAFRRAYWRGGHDISGHSFLLTHSSLFLLTEIAPTLGALAGSFSSGAGAVTPAMPPSRARWERASKTRQSAAIGALALIGIWWWMLLVGFKLSAMYARHSI